MLVLKLNMLVKWATVDWIVNGSRSDFTFIQCYAIA